MMTSAQVVETSVTITDNSPSQDYTHPNDQTTLLHVFVLCYILPRVIGTSTRSYRCSFYDKKKFSSKKEQKTIDASEKVSWSMS